MSPLTRFCLGTATLALAAGCAKKDATDTVTNNTALAVASAPAAAPTAAATPAAATPAGFDPATAPVGTAPSGAFPYFGLMDGFHAVTREEAGSFAWENQHESNYDRYEFFDGTKLVPVEGKLRTVQAIGTGRSIYEAMKNYQKLVTDLGGVTVFEGTGGDLDKLHLDYRERRHRNRYSNGDSEKLGVYLLRTPVSQIWVEVTQYWDDKPDNYWLTVVETKPLDVSVKLVPAAALKQALDATGHVALYVNFATDQTAVLPQSQPMLAEVVKLLAADPTLKLTIEGHTDNAGSPAHNQALSQGRANAVMGTLIAQGIDPTRLAAKGFGQTKPIADNATDDGKAKNRRVELVKR